MGCLEEVSMDRISAMNMFVRVVESGSFSAVARELKTTQPTISKNIAELESWLGAKLLSRSTRKLHLTEVGADYYERCITILQDIEEAEQNVGHLQTQPKGTLRINTVVAFGRLHVIPLLGEFFQRYPDIKIELSLNDRVVDMVAEGLDLAIRMGNLTDSSLLAKKIACTPFVTVASKSYLQKHGRPNHPSELKNHEVIVYTGRNNYQQLEFFDNGKPIVVSVDGRLLTNNTEASREALLNGYGIATVPKWLVGDAIRNGKLEPLLESYQREAIDIYAVYPGGRHLANKTRLFIDFLVERLGSSASLIH